MAVQRVTIEVLNLPAFAAFFQRVAEIEEAAGDMGSYEIKSELSRAIETLMADVQED